MKQRSVWSQNSPSFSFFLSLTWVRNCGFFQFKATCEASKVKVKRTLVQALTLCTARMPQRGSRGIIALPFHDHGTRSGWGVSVTPRPLFTPGKDPVPIVHEAVWAPGPVWTGAENLAPTGIRFPDRPARSPSLYRLSYRAHCEARTKCNSGAKAITKRFACNTLYTKQYLAEGQLQCSETSSAFFHIGRR